MHHCMLWAVRTVVALGLGLVVTPVGAGPVPVVVAAAPPVIVRAEVDPLEPDRLVIRGKNFGVEAAPIVLLSDVVLDVVSFSNEQIVVRLPLDAPAARYRLQVLAYGAAPSAPFRLTLGGGAAGGTEG